MAVIVGQPPCRAYAANRGIAVISSLTWASAGATTPLAIRLADRVAAPGGHVSPHSPGTSRQSKTPASPEHGFGMALTTGGAAEATLDEVERPSSEIPCPSRSGTAER